MPEIADSEAVARKLYEQWWRGCNRGKPTDGRGPNWAAYESGGDLNVVGLNADSFRQEAEQILPLDTAEAVARRLCLATAPQECMGLRGPACTEATCTGWKDWLADARELMDECR